jgi:hypothetical protein
MSMPTGMVVAKLLESKNTSEVQPKPVNEGSGQFAAHAVVELLQKNRPAEPSKPVNKKLTARKA